jgi:hypothetical protein
MMNTKIFLRSTLNTLWGVTLIWGAVFANNILYDAISRQNPHVHTCINDLFSDAVLLLVAFMPVLWAPKFFWLPAWYELKCTPEQSRGISHRLYSLPGWLFDPRVIHSIQNGHLPGEQIFPD